jgi:hypothetical protein
MDEDEAYMRHLEQVNAGAPVLSGTQPESNPESFNYSRFGNGEENLVARTFAALPSTYQSRSSRPNTRESDSRTEYWRNNSCVYSTITWNGKTLHLPVVAPFSESVLVKRTILEGVISRLLASESVPWIDRCDILTQKFKEHAPIIDSNAKSALIGLQNSSSLAFSFDNAEIVDNTLKVIPIGNVITAAQSRQARYVQFNVTISSRNLPIDNTEFPDLIPAEWPNPVNFLAYMSLPKIGNQLHHNLTANLFAGPVEDLIHEIGAVHEIIMLAIGRSRNTPTAEAAETYMREYYNKTKFSVLSQLLRPLYVGKNLGMQSLDQRIQSLKMTQHHNGNIEFLTVQELFTQYQTHLAELDTSIIGAGDNLQCLVRMFCNALSDRLVQKRLAMKIPETNPTSYAHNLEAKVQEMELQTIAAVAANAVRRANPVRNTAIRNNAPHAFPVARTFLTTLPPDASNEFKNMPIPTYQNESELLTMYCTNLVLLSSAEQAMRQASGLKAPLLCWGCEGLSKYSGKDNTHSYRDCPNKTDPDVVQNFLLNLQKFRDARKNRNTSSPYGGAAALAIGNSGGAEDRNWAMMGFASKDQMETFTQIADPTTSKQARKAMIAALAIPSESESGKEPEQKKFRRVFFTYNMQENPERMPEPLTYYHSFLANRFARFAYPISDSLPFIDVPIGRVIAENGQPQDYLRGLADTGGCCTMAWKPYMLRLKEKFPHYIEDHTVLKERQFEDIRIGGIQGGVFITDVMTLFLPFTTDGSNHRIMLGLTDDLPINVLYGLPFLLQAQITLDMDAQTAKLRLLGTAFKLTLRSPKRLDIETIDHKTGPSNVYVTPEEKSSIQE